MGSAATPEAGFADGDGAYARFDGPSGLVAAENGTLFVADTNNHLVRVLKFKGGVICFSSCFCCCGAHSLHDRNGGIHKLHPRLSSKG